MLLAISPKGASGDVTATHVEWRTKKFVPHNPSPLLVDDALYLVSDKGVASCLDARSGEKRWEHRIGGDFSASPLYADGKIFLQNEAGEGIVLKPGREYQELARNPLGERTLASYAIGDGALFIRSPGHGAARRINKGLLRSVELRSKLQHQLGDGQVPGEQEPLPCPVRVAVSPASPMPFAARSARFPASYSRILGNHVAAHFRNSREFVRDASMRPSPKWLLSSRAPRLRLWCNAGPIAVIGGRLGTHPMNAVPNCGGWLPE